MHHNTNAGIALSTALLATRSSERVVRQRSGLSAGRFRYSSIRSPAEHHAGNSVHDNEDSGIDSDSGANDTLVNNIAYRNGDHGIDDSKAPGTRIIANTVYKNTTSGINVEGSSTA